MRLVFAEAKTTLMCSLRDIGLMCPYVPIVVQKHVYALRIS